MNFLSSLSKPSYQCLQQNVFEGSQAEFLVALKVPESHREHDTLPVDVGKMLVPIFQRLTDSNLINRCKHKQTQNPNESLYNML